MVRTEYLVLWGNAQGAELSKSEEEMSQRGGLIAFTRACKENIKKIEWGSLQQREKYLWLTEWVRKKSEAMFFSISQSTKYILKSSYGQELLVS